MEEQEVSSGSVSIDEDNFEIDHDNEQIRDVENQIDQPKKGMEFDSLDELMAFYARYARGKGFAVSKRSSTKKQGVVRYVALQCTRAGTSTSKSTNPLNVRPTSKIGCKAKLRAFHCLNGKWSVTAVELSHNHEMSPGKSRYFKCNRFLQPHVKRRLMLSDKAGIRVNKNFNSLVIEAGGHENLSFTEKDVRNYINKVRRLQLREGDANAMHNYFLKMQSNNSDFFYMMDLDEKGRLKNVFWADARSRAVFKEFGDVVTFDTIYLVNKYDMPFAPFVGVNHHGQSDIARV